MKEYLNATAALEALESMHPWMPEEEYQIIRTALTNAPEVLTVDQLTQIIQSWAFTDLGPYEKFGDYLSKKYPSGIKIIKGEAK